MTSTNIALAIATDLNAAHIADGKHAQLVRELVGHITRETADGRRYATPAGRLAKSAEKAIAAWRAAA